MLKRGLAGLALFGIFSTLFLVLSRIPYFLSGEGETTLQLTLQAATPSGERCRPATEQEKAQMLAHMRVDKICERSRAETGVRLTIDGKVWLDRFYKPLGLRSDGMSAGFENFSLNAGEHDVRLEIRDDGKATGFNREFARRLAVEPNRRYLIEYKTGAGFNFHSQ